MSNIPNLGDFGYVPATTKTCNVNWLVVPLIAICTGIVCYLIYSLFVRRIENPKLIRDKEIANTSQNSSGAFKK